MPTVRQAIRGLRRAPGFALLAILTIALGAGVNTAVFSILHSVLLKSLPFQEPGRLVRFNETKEGAVFNLSYPNFKDWQHLNTTFGDMAVYTAFGNNPIKLPKGQMMVATGATSWNLFSVLGVHPILGRTFRPEDDLGDGANLAVITYQAWEKYFDKDPQVLDRQVMFYGQPISIAGVLPRDVLLSGVEFWFPRGEVHNPNQLDRGNHPGFQGIGRLKPGVTLEQARTNINTIAAALERQYPASNRAFRVRILPLLDATVMRVKPMIWILFGAVGFVLLIACANVTNLLLVRCIHREREFALRTALGASTRQSMALVLCESLIIAAVGAALGLALADWGFLAILKIEPGVLPSSRPVSVNPTVFAYGLLLTILSALIFGLAPAWRAARGNVTAILKQGARGSAASPRTRRARAVLLPPKWRLPSRW